MPGGETVLNSSGDAAIGHPLVHALIVATITSSSFHPLC